MFELTEVIEPAGMRYETRKTSVLLDHVKRLAQHTRHGATIYFMDGTSIVVAESIDRLTKMFRDYAEAAQKERFRAVVREELAKALPEMAEKAWRYDETSK